MSNGVMDESLLSCHGDIPSNLYINFKAAAAQYSAVQCNTIQHNTVHYTAQ